MSPFLFSLIQNILQWMRLNRARRTLGTGAPSQQSCVLYRQRIPLNREYPQLALAVVAVVGHSGQQQQQSEVLPHNIAEEIHSPTETGRHYAAAEANTAEKSESKVGEERKKPPCSCVVVCVFWLCHTVCLACSVLSAVSAAVLCQSPVPSAAQYHHHHTEKCSILAACAPTTFQHSSSVQCAEGFFAVVPARIEHHWIQSPSLCFGFFHTLIFAG